MEEWFQSLYEDVNAVILIGPKPVAVEAVALHRILTGIIRHLRAVLAGEEPEATLDATLEALLKTWTPTRRRLINAMRQDVATDGTGEPLDWDAIPRVAPLTGSEPAQ